MAAPSIVETVPVRSPAAESWVIGLLFVVYTLNFLDRQIVNILAEPIKQDLGLQDWQLGVISGLAFAVFYTTLGVPLARWADRPRANRSLLIAGSLAVWSGMTMACAGAANFFQLMLARFGVGVGEAGCSPAAHSLISDLIPPERRATALGVYALGIPVGKLFGMAIGGWIALNYGWRAAFLLVGAPGLAVALLVWLTIKDPRRQAVHMAGSASTLGESFGLLRRSAVFWLGTLGCAFTSFISLGSAAFLGSFLIRIHHLSVGQAGLWLGLALGIGGSLGSWLGGVLCDHFGRRDRRAYMVLPGVASLLGGGLVLAAVLAPSVEAALLLLAGSAVLTSFWYGPVFSTVQGIVPPSSRATAAAVHLFVVNIIGLGLGPVAIGMVSDLLNVGVGPLGALGPAEGLRWSLAISAGAAVIAAGFFAAAATKVSAELRS
jgi:predicted MFS family arabinose efflux permease